MDKLALRYLPELLQEQRKEAYKIPDYWRNGIVHSYTKLILRIGGFIMAALVEKVSLPLQERFQRNIWRNVAMD